MKKWDHYNFFSLHIKMCETSYYQRNRNVVLNIAKGYYKNDKERLKVMQEINKEIYLQ